MITRLLSFIAIALVFAPVCLNAQGVITIDIENVQSTRAVAAIVHDPAGFPMAGVLVEELTSDWKESLRSTKTNASGAFTFAPAKGRDVYYFQLTLKGFDPLRVRVRVDHKRGKELRLQMEPST
jgi:hypothetical protein